MFQYNDDRLDILITGTGRCGTVYAARLLTSAGVPCGHESIFTPGGIKQAKSILRYRQSIEISNISKDENWILKDKIPNIKADSSYMAAPYLSSSIVSKSKAVHLIRNPVMVISSFVVDFKYFSSRDPEDEYQKFIYQHLPILQNPMNQIKRAVTYYREWNNMIEKRKDCIIHKIEDGGPRLLDKVGICYDSENLYDNKRANSKRRLPRLSMYDFQSSNALKEINDLIDKYEYSQNIFNTIL